MNGITGGGTEARVGSSMFEGEMVESEEFELVYGESEGLGDVSRCEKLRQCVRLRGDGHVLGGRDDGSFCILGGVGQHVSDWTWIPMCFLMMGIPSMWSGIAISQEVHNGKQWARLCIPLWTQLGLEVVMGSWVHA